MPRFKDLNFIYSQYILVYQLHEYRTKKKMKNEGMRYNQTKLVKTERFVQGIWLKIYSFRFRVTNLLVQSLFTIFCVEINCRDTIIYLLGFILI